MKCAHINNINVHNKKKCAKGNRIMILINERNLCVNNNNNN